MTWNGYTVEYNTTFGATYGGRRANNADWVTLSNVVGVQCSVGRQNILDAWPISQATFTIRYPNGYSTPLTRMQMGQQIRFTFPGGSNPGWFGTIRDVRVEWGVPYANSKGEADYLIILAEGGLAQWGRANTFADTIAGGDFLTALSLVAVANGLSYTTTLTNERVDSVANNNNLLEWVQKSVTTFQGRLLDGNFSAPTASTKTSSIYIGKANKEGLVATKFSDTTNNATSRRFQSFEFDSLADNYYDEVLVQGQSSITGQASAGATDTRTLSISAIPETTAQAENLADYLLSQFDAPLLAPSAISAISEGQHTNNLDTLGTTDFWKLPLYKVQIDFRGTTYYAQIEGVTVTATPEQSRFTYYLSPQDMNNYLILDDAVFGKLDQNRLGIW